MQLKFIIVLYWSLWLSGCTTLYFDRGAPVAETDYNSVTEWHHNFAFDLYEYNAVVNLASRCAHGDWRSVKTELSLSNGLAGAAANSLAGMGMTLPLWYPKSVTTTCAPLLYEATK